MKLLPLLAVAAFTFTVPAAAQDTAATVNVIGKPIVTDAFFERPLVTGAKMSPNGRFVALHAGELHKSRFRLLVLDLVDKTLKPAAVFLDADVGDYHWLNDEKLVFTTRDGQVKPGERPRGGTWVYTANRDGTGLTQITGQDVNRRRLPGKMLSLRFSLFSPGAQKDNHVWMTETNWGAPEELYPYSEPIYVNLWKVDTTTREKEFAKRPTAPRSWVLDYHGEPRLTTSIDGGTVTYHYRDPAANNSWRTLKTMSAFKVDKDGWAPVAFGPDGSLYVTALNGRDKRALFRLDFSTGEVQPTPVVALEDFDFGGTLLFSDDKLIGVRYTSDATGTMWFDDKWKTVQEEVNARLPKTANSISVPRRPSTPWVMITAESAQQPRQTLVYNTQTRELAEVGNASPEIDPRRMSPSEFVRYKARDGLDIPAWVTIPAGSGGKHLPMVVYVHGGPHQWAQSWEYDRNVQFLASRGYAVLQPQFRGTFGYGDKHYRSAFKQWGKAMQDDIADGTQWAIKQGIADPKRICIIGGSYGGYSAMMGLINDPGLYKCGVNWHGITDLNLLYKEHWSVISDTTERYKKYGMPDLIGDPVKDAEQLKATSPLEQAHRITQPLLMAYGARDTRVPIYHGRKLHDKLSTNNKQVELVVYDDEGHGWTYPKNSIDWWNRVEKFLGKHIGPQ
jgi:dipeptidyl aminopeptidase/acylaminoacyl peptidase